MRLANRLSRLGTETAFVVLRRAKQLEREGQRVVHLEIGEPDSDTPRNIIDKAIEALNNHATHYGPSEGLPELREAVAQHISQSRNVSVLPENVVITPGAKPIMFFAMLALVNEGEEVIYPNPGFPIYESIINFIGANAVPIQLREENQFRLDVDELRRKVTPKTRLLIINSPQNPTGSVLTKEDLEEIAKIACDHDIYVLSDEIYSRCIYDCEHYSIMTFPGMQERTVLLDGFSKTYAMTGWRLGYGVMPQELAEQVTKLQTNCTSCTATFTQIAGVEALTGSQESVGQMVAKFRKRRDLIVKLLNEIEGISCLVPDGAFYVFPNVTKVGLRSAELADRLLEEKGVAVLSGTAFGAYGEGYLRLSYAASEESIEDGVGRIKEFILNLRRT